MHILVAVLHRPVQPTGVCRHAANLAACLALLPEITRVTVVTGAWQRHYFESAFALHGPKIDFVQVDIANTTRARNQWFLFGLPRLARRLKADVVHLTFPTPILRTLFHCPVVATIHDLYPFEVPENFGRLRAVFNRALFALCVRQADSLICISQQTLVQLRRYFPRRAARPGVRVIYNYVDFSAVRPEVPHGMGRPDLPPFVLTVAQHRKNKNIDLLIAAHRRLLDEGRFAAGAELYVVGTDGPETAALQSQVVTLGLQAQVHFLSSISDAQLCWLYRHCQQFVIASSAEGFCAPLVEALENGAFVVCSDIPILREIGQADSRYFDLQGDALAHLVRCMEEVLAAPDAPRPGGGRFARDTAALAYLDFYRQVQGQR